MDKSDCLGALARYDAVRRGDNVLLTSSSASPAANSNMGPFDLQAQTSRGNQQLADLQKGF